MIPVQRKLLLNVVVQSQSQMKLDIISYNMYVITQENSNHRKVKMLERLQHAK